MRRAGCLFPLCSYPAQRIGVAQGGDVDGTEDIDVICLWSALAAGDEEESGRGKGDGAGCGHGGRWGCTFGVDE